MVNYASAAGVTLDLGEDEFSLDLDLKDFAPHSVTTEVHLRTNSTSDQSISCTDECL